MRAENAFLWKRTRAENFRLTPEMIERQITPRTRAIIINSPNNPSGAVMDPHDFTAILRLAHKRGIYVIADECYVYLNFTPRRFSAGSINDVKQHLVIVGSLSKTYAMTGWRLGYALAPAPIINAMTKLQSQSTSSTAHMVQMAGLAAVTGPQNCVEKMKKDYVLLRELTLGHLTADSGRDLRKAGRSVLRLSQRVGVFRQIRDHLCGRCCQTPAP